MEVAARLAIVPVELSERRRDAPRDDVAAGHPRHQMRARSAARWLRISVKARSYVALVSRNPRPRSAVEGMPFHRESGIHIWWARLSHLEENGLD
jgi:hypothetical protein